MLNLSLNEIYSETYKAYRSVGIEWGIAKDGANLSRWLAEHNFYFLGSTLKNADLYKTGKISLSLRNNTLKKYGPVREVEKTFVIEIAFDSVNYSKRHKSGVALRFPRIKRLREDKPVQEVLQLSQFKLDFGLDAK